MSKNCPNCNHSVRPDARYCGFCGANLAATVETRPSSLQSNRNKPAERTNQANQNQRNQTVHDEPDGYICGDHPAGSTDHGFSDMSRWV